MDRKSWIIIIAAILVPIAGIYMTLQTPSIDRTLIGSEVAASRVTFNGEPTSSASVSIPFTRKDDTFSVANIAIDLNKDNEIKAYDTDAGIQEEWVVKNMRAKVIEAGNTYSFELVDPNTEALKGLHLVAVLTKKSLEDWNGTVPPGEGAAQQVIISHFEEEDFGALFKPVNGPDNDNAGQSALLAQNNVPENAPRTPNPSPTKASDFTVDDPTPYITDVTVDTSFGGAGEAAIGAEAAANQLPAEGSDFEVFQPGVPDLNQGEMECVPTSISNGLQWLADAYDFEDRMPDSQTKTREELKPDLNWSQEEGAGMGASFLAAKVAFTARHNLPIHTHRIGGKFDEDIVRKIAVELRNGQAVEVGVGYYVWNTEANEGNGEWQRGGGHMMSGVGAFGSNGETYIGVHDPLSQESGRLDMYNVEGSRIYNYRYRGNTAVFIEFAYAQSPNEAWVAEHAMSVDLDVSGMSEGANLSSTWFVDMIQIGTAWFPVKQFHTFTGDEPEECDAEEHWHSNGNPVWGLDMTGHSYYDTNPESVVARGASVVSWSDAAVCGAGKTAEVARHNVMVSRAEAMALLGKIL